MTNQELKLECYKAVGPKSVGRLEEAKDLYEWVTEEDREEIRLWLKQAKEIGVLRSDIDTPVEEVVSNLEKKDNPTEILIITDEDIVDLHYKGEDIIVCRSWEHIPEDRGGKTAFWVTRVFEDEGITTTIKFI